MPKIARKRDDESGRGRFRLGRAAAGGQPPAAGAADTQGATGSRSHTLLQRWQRRRGKRS